MRVVKVVMVEKVVKAKVPVVMLVIMAWLEAMALEDKVVVELYRPVQVPMVLMAEQVSVAAMVLR